jgi:two-component system cell cycle response regulator
VDAEYELQTRVTRLDGLRVQRTGEDCLVVIYAPSSSELGRRYVLSLPSVAIGRGRDNDIVLKSDCVSRRHARLERRPDGVYLIDVGSTNGTFVNDDAQRVTERRLRRGDQFSIGDTIFKFLTGDDVEAQYHDIVFRMAITDGLTNLANRKQLDAVLAEEVPRAQRQGLHLSLLMIDIDHFKSINDNYGHLTGDSVLRGVAAALQKRTRPNDKLARYGGGAAGDVAVGGRAHCRGSTLARRQPGVRGGRAGAAGDRVDRRRAVGARHDGRAVVCGGRRDALQGQECGPQPRVLLRHP